MFLISVAIKAAYCPIFFSSAVRVRRVSVYIIFILFPEAAMATQPVQDTSIMRQDSSFVNSKNVPQDEKKSAAVPEGYISQC
jgi:hypothetical protein